MAKKNSSGITDSDILSMFETDFEQAQQQLSSKTDDWRRYYENTYIFDQVVSDKTMHNVFIAKIYETLWNMMPRLIGNQPKFVLTSPQGKVDDQKLIDLKDFHTQEWKRADATRKIREAAQLMGVYGTAFMSVEWMEEDIMVWNRKKKMNEVQGTIGKNKLCVQDIYDVWIDPRYSDLQDSPYCIYVKRGVSITDLEAQGYDVEEFKGDSKGNSDDGEDKKNQNFTRRGFNDMDKQAKGTADVYYYYTKNDKGEPIQAIIINRTAVVSNKTNPFPHQKYPIVKFVYQEMPNEAYGIGFGEMLEGLQLQNNLMRNMRLDNVFKAIKGRFIYDTSQGTIDEEQFRDLSNDLVKAMGGAQALTPIKVPDVTANSFNEAQKLEQDMQTLSGINNFTQDTASGFNDTATGTQILQNVANQRINAVLENLEMGIAEAGEMMLQNNLAFQENDNIERVTGGEEFDLQEFNFPFNVNVESGSTSVQTNFKEKEEAQIFMNVLTPFIQAGAVQMGPVLEKFFDSYQIKNKGEFTQAPEGPAQEQPQEGEAPQEEEGAPINPKAIEALTSIVSSGKFEIDEEGGALITDKGAVAFEEAIPAFRAIAASPGFENAPQEGKTALLTAIGKINQLIQQ